MKSTTLRYLERGDQYLMLHRTRKANDANHDKWLGIGGHIEPGETPMDCILREAREETGFKLLDCRYRGIVHFRSDRWEDEEMYLFSATSWEGAQIPCDEGDLEWIDKRRLFTLTLWEGDRVFLKLLEEGRSDFDLILRYEGEHLAEAVLNGKAVK